MNRSEDPSAGLFTVCAGLLVSISMMAAPCRDAIHASTPTRWELSDKIAQWRLVQERALPADSPAVAHADGHWQRIYRSDASGDLLKVTLISGPPGPMCAHRPEICLRKSDYQAISPPECHRLSDTTKAALWVQEFEPVRLGLPRMTVAYGWHDGNKWIAPRYPRLSLAGRRRIARLQMTIRHRVTSSRDASKSLERVARSIAVQPSASAVKVWKRAKANPSFQKKSR